VANILRHQNLGPGNKDVFYSESEIFFVDNTKLVAATYVPSVANWETLTSATMFPSLGPDIGHIDNIYFNWEYLRAVFRYQFLVLV